MIWKRIVNRIKGRPSAFESDLDEEMAFHLEMKEREHRQIGLSVEDARTAARRSMGNLTMAREDARAAWQFRWVSDFAADLRFGARSLLAQPGYLAAATFALTLGIGLTAVVFTVYNALALAPWALRDPAHLVQVLSERGAGRWSGFSWPELRYLRDHTRTLSALTGWDPTGLRVTRGDVSWNAPGMAVAENFFDSLGTGFAAGRGFSAAATEIKDPAPEVVLHYDTWQNRFGGDRAAVGQWIELNGHRLQIVGVAAPGFSGPSPNQPELWIPAAWRDIFHPGLDTIDTPDSCCAELMGRLNPGVGRAAAQAELAALSAAFRRSVGQKPTRLLLANPSMLGNPTTHGKAAPVFLIVFVAALLVLLLAATNVANLLLARGAARHREIAVRLSLGAGWMRILRQLLAESLLLSLPAAILTLAIAAALPGAIIGWIAPPDERISFRFATDWRVAGFVLAVSFATGLLSALAPALKAVRDGAAAGLREAGGRISARSRLRTALLAAQLALCATLLGGTSLLIRAMQHAAGIDPGFRYSDVTLLSPGLGASGLSNEQAVVPIQALRERLSNLPGVVSVAYTSVLPLGNSFAFTSVPDPHSRSQVRTGFTQVSAGFFETLGIPLLAGRSFGPVDESRHDLVIVNQALADRLWPGENPLGKSVSPDSKPLQVIGVVRSIGTRELGSSEEPQMYLPFRGSRDVELLVRCTSPELLPGLPKVARATDRRFFASAMPYGDLVQRARRPAAVAASVSSAFSLIALGLAFVGLYAVTSYQVTQRTKEIGVRIALGAKPVEVAGLMIRQNLRPVLAGSALGIAGALALARLLSSLLYGLSPGDPLALLMTVAVLSATALLAVWPPARRAAALDPAAALRAE